MGYKGEGTSPFVSKFLQHRRWLIAEREVRQAEAAAKLAVVAEGDLGVAVKGLLMPLSTARCEARWENPAADLPGRLR